MVRHDAVRHDAASKPTRAHVDDTALARAAADLDALRASYEECTRTLEDVEATVDALLDDPQVRVLVLDESYRVVAMSRGMVPAMGPSEAALGVAVAELVPSSWPAIVPAAAGLSSADGWQELPLADGSGRLCLRRVNEDDREARYLVRFDAAPSPPET